MKKQKLFYGWILVVITFIYFWLYAGISTDMLNVTVGFFAAENGWEQASLLALSSPAGWIGVIGTIVFAQVVIKIGSRWASVISLIAAGVTMMFYGQVKSIAAYAVCIILVAFFSNCFGNVTTGTIASSWFPKKRGYALGWSSMGMCFSSLCFVALTTFLINKMGISKAFIVLGAIIIAVGIISIFVVKDNPEDMGLAPDNDPSAVEDVEKMRAELANYKSDWTIKRLLTHKEMWLQAIAYGLMFLAVVGIMSQMVGRFMSYGYSQNVGLTMLSVASVGGLVGSYVFGLLDEKISTKKASLILCVWYIIALLVLVIGGGNMVTSAIGVIMAGAGIGGVGNVQLSMIAQIYGRYDYAAAARVVNPIVGLFRTSGFLVISLSITLTGGFNGCYLFLVVALVVAAVLIGLMNDKCVGKQ